MTIRTCTRGTVCVWCSNVKWVWPKVNSLLHWEIWKTVKASQEVETALLQIRLVDSQMPAM